MKKSEKRLLEAKTQVLKALAHPTRLWITEKLKDGECCVNHLVEAIGADFSTVSKHLSVLKEAGILEDEKRGKQVFYTLKVPCVLNFMNCVEEVIQTRINEQMDLFSKNDGE